jgi:hypothetical protein
MTGPDIVSRAMLVLDPDGEAYQQDILEGYQFGTEPALTDIHVNK